MNGVYNSVPESLQANVGILPYWNTGHEVLSLSLICPPRHPTL